MTNNKQQTISKQRTSEFGEVFTNEREVKAMLDLVKHETDRIDSRFLEPACGTGNFLVEILNRKLNIVETKYRCIQLDYEANSVLAITSIYGIDLLQDNIENTRKRLFNIFNTRYQNFFKDNCKPECIDTVKHILSKNIIRGNALTLETVEEDCSPAEPIIFTEWSFASGNKIKRREFTLNELLKKSTPPKDDLYGSGGLFAEQVESHEAFIPNPIKEHPLIHFLRVGEDVR